MFFIIFPYIDLPNNICVNQRLMIFCLFAVALLAESAILLWK